MSKFGNAVFKDVTMPSRYGERVMVERGYINDGDHELHYRRKVTFEDGVEKICYDYEVLHDSFAAEQRAARDVKVFSMDEIKDLLTVMHKRWGDASPSAYDVGWNSALMSVLVKLLRTQFAPKEEPATVTPPNVEEEIELPANSTIGSLAKGLRKLVDESHESAKKQESVTKSYWQQLNEEMQATEDPSSVVECLEVFDTGDGLGVFQCTLPAGHDGPHIAGGPDGEEYQRWEN